MPSTHRCVFGCETTGVTIHKFPNPLKYPEQFRAWVQLAGECLTGMTDDAIYKNRNICDKHFAEYVKNRNNRLNVLAIPTLHLPKMSVVTLELNRGFQIHLPSTSSVHLPEKMVTEANESDEHEQTNPSSITRVTPQTTDYSTFSVVDNDHMYYRKPNQSSKQPHSKDIRKHHEGFAYYKASQRDIRHLKAEICRLRKRSHNFKTRLASAMSISEDKALQKVTSKMNLPAKLFTKIQYRETSKKAKGRRFTNEEKILSLSFFKRSPKCYALLSKCFTLPSTKSLKNLLGKIKISPGITRIIFEKLKHSAEEMNKDDCLCTLIFDEMSIKPQVHYNAAQDELKGFTSLGKNNIADHVLTFMIRGIKRNFKQPVAYYFTNSLNKLDLKNAIKEVIRHVQSTGLKILATVCDQSTINVSAIESLVNDSKEIFLKKGLEWKNKVIVSGNQKIIPLYDCPHLLKGIRNNLLTKNLKYIDPEDGKEKIVKWEYLQQVYAADTMYGELTMLHKLTEDHLNPSRINKMKVNTATQIFSHSVAAATQRLVDCGKLGPEYSQIVPLVLFLDKLFDSVNCNTYQMLNGKLYRTGVKHHSPHHKMWQDAIIFLKNMKFIEHKTIGHEIRITEKIVPSITNFIITLQGFQALWKILHKKYAFDVMFCRNFNQDPLKNFFGSVRSLGVRNIAPNTVGFEGAFKALLLNNFCTSHSVKSNCEDDMTTFLQSVDFFLKSTDCRTVDREKTESKEFIIDDLLKFDENNERNDPESYVCGWVLKKCLKKIIKGCQYCKNNIVSFYDIASNAYIKAKEYENNKKWLCYPSEELKQCFSDIQNVTVDVLKKGMILKDLKKHIKLLNEVFVDFNIFNCAKHKIKLKEFFEDTTINIVINSWCRSVNRILSGKLKYDGDDECKKKAQLYYEKQKHNKNRK